MNWPVCLSIFLKHKTSGLAFFFMVSVHKALDWILFMRDVTYPTPQKSEH